MRDAQAKLPDSRRGECDDNAQAESRWLRLKTEEPEARHWPIFADAHANVATYFDCYNHERRHSSIGHQKPYQFHEQRLANITHCSPA
ncbi:integrase core domain-containing protein [Hymenobacter terricola]|uniref:integrase core domain-containing protein n=1 Tax=Hymenobacter terricola TaxID=2819236 RepID=UPI001B30E96C|nr:integrase core domain-containing protein [Hymenobacter terricola]